MSGVIKEVAKNSFAMTLCLVEAEGCTGYVRSKSYRLVCAYTENVVAPSTVYF